MNSAFSGLLFGLLGAIVLIYLLIVVNFQSWSDPFVIITALPAALAGIVWMLFATHTTLSVPALTGAIMCMGVATANSVLVISFARERYAELGDPVAAALEAGFVALPPGADDGAGDDHRHGADGARAGRGRRAERAARPRRDRRPDLRNDRDADVRSRGVQHGTQEARRQSRRRTGDVACRTEHAPAGLAPEAGHFRRRRGWSLARCWSSSPASARARMPSAKLQRMDRRSGHSDGRGGAARRQGAQSDHARPAGPARGLSSRADLRARQRLSEELERRYRRAGQGRAGDRRDRGARPRPAVAAGQSRSCQPAGQRETLGSDAEPPQIAGRLELRLGAGNRRAHRRPLQQEGRGQFRHRPMSSGWRRWPATRRSRRRSTASSPRAIPTSAR